MWFGWSTVKCVVQPVSESILITGASEMKAAAEFNNNTLIM